MKARGLRAGACPGIRAGGLSRSRPPLPGRVGEVQRILTLAGDAGHRPSLSAASNNPERSEASSLRIRFARWNFTVLTDTNSARAICGRSEERRVGKAGRCRMYRAHEHK